VYRVTNVGALFCLVVLLWRKVCGQNHQCGCSDTMKECENTAALYC